MLLKQPPLSLLQQRNTGRILHGAAAGRGPGRVLPAAPAPGDTGIEVLKASLRRAS